MTCVGDVQVNVQKYHITSTVLWNFCNEFDYHKTLETWEIAYYVYFLHVAIEHKSSVLFLSNFITHSLKLLLYRTVAMLSLKTMLPELVNLSVVLITDFLRLSVSVVMFITQHLECYATQPSLNH